MADPVVRDCWVGAPAIFKLNQCSTTINKAYEGGQCFLVGSSLVKRDYRDVDVRLILPNDLFAHAFGELDYSSTQYHPRMSLLSVVVSDWLSKETGLPVDFQFVSAGRHQRMYADKPKHELGYFYKMNAMPSPDYIKNVIEEEAYEIQRNLAKAT